MSWWVIFCLHTISSKVINHFSLLRIEGFPRVAGFWVPKPESLMQIRWVGHPKPSVRPFSSLFPALCPREADLNRLPSPQLRSLCLSRVQRVEGISKFEAGMKGMDIYFCPPPSPWKKKWWVSLPEHAFQEPRTFSSSIAILYRPAHPGLRW